MSDFVFDPPRGNLAYRGDCLGGPPSPASAAASPPPAASPVQPLAPVPVRRETCHAPLLHDQEWANALTHGGAALLWLFGAVLMVRAAAGQEWMASLCCLVFVLSAVSVFAASALSHHLIHDPALLKRLRAWDQGLIYAMIAGTYTPLIWRYSDEAVRGPLLVAIWVAAAVGFHSKVIAERRVNSIGTFTYLALGWFPALGLVGRVPGPVLFWMAAGGILYTLGVVLLINDRKLRYLHAGWHLMVFIAASCHFWAIYHYVAIGA